MLSPLFGSAHEAFFFSCRYCQDLSEQPAEKFHVWRPSPPSFPCGDRGAAGIEGQRNGDAGKRGRTEACGGVPCAVLQGWLVFKRGNEACVCKGIGKPNAMGSAGKSQVL